MSDGGGCNTCGLYRRGEHTGTILSDDATYRGRLNTVDDVVACPGYEMAVAKNLHFILEDSISALSPLGHEKENEAHRSYIV